MINFQGYHGTNSARVESILTYGFKLSRGNKEWLGDGVYFFIHGKSKTPENQAEQWAILSAWDKSAKQNTYTDFSVLKADIRVDESNFLDLTSPDGLEIFEYIKLKILKKLSPRKLSNDVIDGIVVNFGRAELKLRFDVVKGDVFIKLTLVDRIYNLNSRLANSTICSVYNEQCLSNIEIIKTATI